MPTCRHGNDRTRKFVPAGIPGRPVRHTPRSPVANLSGAPALFVASERHPGSIPGEGLHGCGHEEWRFGAWQGQGHR